MDLAINFWDNVVNKVYTSYLGSTFMGHAQYQDLFMGDAQHQDLFEHLISVLDSWDLLQVSMDGPSVNWAFFSGLRNYRTKNDMSKLLSTGSCRLHAIYGALKTGEQNKVEVQIGNSKKF